MDAPTDSRRAPTANGEGEPSPLEQEVLDEYAKLVGNLDSVCFTIDRINFRSLHTHIRVAFQRSS